MIYTRVTPQIDQRLDKTVQIQSGPFAKGENQKAEKSSYLNK